MAGTRIVFMGTPDLAAACLDALVKSPGLDVIAAVSQPDRPKGRGQQLQPTAVKLAAQTAGLPVFQPDNAGGDAFLESLRQLKPDVIVVAAYGQILPQTLLDIPPHGCINVHTSLLPRYRGAAPIQWALLNGDAETGVTLMKIAPELDAGDIICQARTLITHEDDAERLHDRLAALGATLLVETLPEYLSGRRTPTPQPSEGVVYARKIRKKDGRIDWTRSATELWNRVRGLRPWPGAFTYLPAEPRPALLKFWKAEPESGTGMPGQILEADADRLRVACGEGALRIVELQTEGKRRMSAREFLAGHPLQPGQQLEAP